MNPDNPKITAYALNDLAEDERRSIEESFGDSPDFKATVRETRALAEELTAAYKAELRLIAEEPHNVLPLPYGRLFWSESRWSRVAMAAALVLAICAIAGLLWRSSSAPNVATKRSQSPLPEITVDGENPVSSSLEQNAGEHPFVLTTTQSIAKLPLQVGTGSLSRVRNYIAVGLRPPASEVRVEELVNAFAYTYPEPSGNEVVTASSDAALCPWNVEHLLVRVGIRFRDAAASAQLSREGVAEVEFNSARVHSYRLIGFEEPSRGTPPGDTASEHESLTALYEIALRPDALASTTGAYLAKARVRSASAPLSESVVANAVGRFEDATADFRFAASVAAFGMILRDSTYKGSAKLDEVIQWASDARGKDAKGERSAFIDLARRTQRLM